MKKLILSSVAMLLVMGSCKKAEDKALDTGTTNSDSIAVKEEPAVTPMDSATMAQAWKEFMTPGRVHEMFANDNGRWNVAMKVWMAPDAPPAEQTMTAESRMILGGRYQEMRHTGEFMGEKFEGISTMGYDNASKKIVSSWIDNMGTGIMYMTGDFDGNSKMVELKGEVTDPVTKKTKTVRETYSIVDDKTRKVEMYDMTEDGKEYKSMEIVMTR